MIVQCPIGKDKIKELRVKLLSLAEGQAKREFRDSIEFVQSDERFSINPDDKRFIEEWKSFDCGENLETLRPNLILPRQGRHISECAKELGVIFKNKQTLFIRDTLKEVMEISSSKDIEGKEKGISFTIVKPHKFITLIEKYSYPVVEEFDKHRNPFLVKKSMGSELANTLLQSPQFQEELPLIERIFSTGYPIYDRENNKLTFVGEGYDKKFRSWLPANAPRIVNPLMSLEEAKEIINSMYKEFCFKTPQDKVNAIAGLLTPFLRGIFKKFNTRTPVFFYEANRERSGKDYCAGINGIVHVGYPVEEAPLSTGERGNNNDELRKKILASLIAGTKILHFSNNKGHINNAVLESAVTNEFYSDRVLGKNEILTFPNELDISLSGNVGISYTSDFANRCRHIRLFLDVEDANERKFENPDLHGWVSENRELVLSALYSLIRNWFEKGRPEGSIKFSSFPEWARVCGGIMECADLGNPCVPDTEILSIGGDIETTEMKRLFELCFEKKPNEWIKRNDIIKLITLYDEDLFSYLDFNKNSDLTKLGMKLNKFEGRIFSDIRMIIKDSKIKGNRREFKFININLKSVTPVNPVTPCIVVNLVNNNTNRDKMGNKGNKGNNKDEEIIEVVKI